jgi:hypothetical protein
MVGNEESKRHQCPFYKGVYCPSGCRGVSPKGIGISERCDWALAIKSRPANGRAKNKAPAKARAASGFHDQGTSGSFSLARTAPITLGEILSHRLVHGEPEERDNGPEVVDGQS